MQIARWAGWAGAAIGGGLLVGLGALWLERALGSGGGGLGLALLALLGGAAVRLRQGRAASCRVGGPRLRPLQVSAFGLMALGVLLLRLAGGGAAATLTAALPALAAPWLPASLVVAGVGWLGLLSLGSDCRDDQLLAAMGQRRP